MHQPCEYKTHECIVSFCNITCVCALDKIIYTIKRMDSYSVASSYLGAIGEKTNRAVLEMKRFS